MSKIGILLINTGTPDAPTPNAVRRYLREFLSDKRIVQLPRIIWLPILYGLVLTVRPSRSAKLYQKIWTPEGSPMRVIMQQLVTHLQNKLGNEYCIEMGMNYGNPSIQSALEKLKQQQVDEIIVLPLFPQYSHTTTASTYDRVKKFVNKWLKNIKLTSIKTYANHPDYISALAKRIQTFWDANGKSEHLLISFHGIPERFVAGGDPYAKECEQTASLLAKELNLSPSEWTLCYQSQFGYDKWLKPSTQALFVELPQKEIKNIDIVCPGFSVDCLETLEEIAIQGKETFFAAGGQTFRYIPALNDGDEQVGMLEKIIRSNEK